MNFFEKLFGFTKSGFELPSFQEMLDRAYQIMEQKTGRVLDRAPDSPLGQLFQVSALFWQDTWKMLQVFVSRFAQPKGIFLDWFAAYTGFKRLPPIRANTILDIYGLLTSSITISALSNFQDTNGKTWNRVDLTDNLGVVLAETSGDIQFPNKNIRSFIIDWGKFQVGVGTLRLTYQNTDLPFLTLTTSATDTVESVQNKLDTILSHLTIVKNFQENSNLWYCELSWGKMFNIDNTAGGVWNNCVATPYQIYVESDEYQENEALGATMIRVLNTGATNIIACNNYLAISRMRGVETDYDLLRRMDGSRRQYSGTSATALEQRMQQEIPNISFCRILENSTCADLKVHENLILPPKSVFPIIEGGSYEAIVNWLERYLPASCISFGNDYQAIRQVTDPVTKQTVDEIAFGWNRPRPIWVNLKIEILEYSEDVPFPANGREQIKQEILSWFYGRYPIGMNLYLKDIYTPINYVLGSGTVRITQQNVRDDVLVDYKTALMNSPFTDQNIDCWDEYICINDIQVV